MVLVSDGPDRFEKISGLEFEIRARMEPILGRHADGGLAKGVPSKRETPDVRFTPGEFRK
jgi:hypothetical protein